MKKYYIINRVLYVFLQWTWGIIQNIMGLCLWIYLRIRKPEAERSFYHGAVVTDWGRGRGSMGLGMFIFFGHKGTRGEKAVLVHEYGHTIQSALLGPFFMPVIGIPSYTWANMKRFAKIHRSGRRSYFDFYPEKWANACGEHVLHQAAPESRRYAKEVTA